MLDSLIGIHHSFAALVLRIVLGIIFVAHGYPKLYKKDFGPKGFAAFLKNLNVVPPLFWAYAVGITEFFGGLCLILGIWTQLASFLIACIMMAAMWKVKFKTGLFAKTMEGGWVGGYELDLSLGAIAVGLTVSGGGVFSLDHLLR